MPLFNQSQLLFGGHVRSVGGTHPLWRIATIYGSVWLRYSRRTSPLACLRWLPSGTTRLGTFTKKSHPTETHVVNDTPGLRGTFPGYSPYPILCLLCFSGAHLRNQHDPHGLLIVKLVSHIQHWGLSVLNSFHDVRLPLKH